MHRFQRFVLGIALAGLVGAAGACGDDEDGTTPPPTDNPPTMTMTAPTGGAAVLPGGTVTIGWTATDDNAVTGVDLSYTADGVAETAIASDVQGSTFDWTVPSSTLYGVVVKGVAKDAAGQTAEDVTTDLFAVVQFSARGYVTSDGCADCHPGYHSDVFNLSGHPYKLNKVSGAPPTYPNSSVPNPPAGVTWDDVTYVIGGYGWKARFIGTEAFNQGYIITAGGLNQYNLETQGWVDYHKDELKPYDCGSCHTTGWQDSDDGDAGNNQDGLTGLVGTFEEPGVTCEQCHGPGAAHASSQSATDITLDASPELCGSCHNRGGANADIPASGGFIRHHEQYNEWSNSVHSTVGVDCATCHDSHVGVQYGNPGFITTCESCHPNEAANNAHIPGPVCVTCHMPQASKSAVAENSFNGDINTHIFTINPAAVGKDQFFNVDGSLVATPTAGVTLDFVCYQCHTDPITLEGGGLSQKSLADLSAKATGIHN